MSKQNRIIFFAALVFVQMSSFAGFIRAQIREATIKIETSAPEIVSVEGTNAVAGSSARGKNFSFVLSYAGVENLGERISDVRLFDENKREIVYKKLVAGEYVAERAFASWSYKIKPEKNETITKAHVSSLSGEQAILMLGDLLPQFDSQINEKTIEKAIEKTSEKRSEKTATKISLVLPQHWRVASTEKPLGENAFTVANVEKAVIYAGKNWREKLVESGDAQLSFIMSGSRQFPDEEAFAMAREIFAFYRQLFGSAPNEKAQIYLGTVGGAQFGRWAAETRGANVTIFSADMPFKTQSVQRLHEQLRHEIFHLWMPNNLNLSGNYDWFYEGFALYESLRMGVAVNRLRFEDFLDTLGRAHSIDTLQTARVSLIEASKNRWSGGANTQIYARGMLVAFLCDIAVLEKSKGKTSLSDVFREIYRQHGFPNERGDGNAAILNVLRARAELRPIVEKYVEGAENIVWKNDLRAFGIESAEENYQTKLSVTPKPTGRQKDLLNELGYNNWRKLSTSPK